MTRFLYYASFAVPALIAFYAMHHYAWVRLVRDPGFPRRWGVVLGALIAALGLTLATVFLLRRRNPTAWADFATAVGYTWLGLLYYLTIGLAAIDVARFLHRRGLRRRWGRKVPLEEPVDEGRRLFMARAISGAAVVGAGSIAAVGRRSAFEITTPEIEVKLARLPSALSGFRIAHLSDLHLGQTLREPFLETVVSKTNALRPDLIVITGDMVDARVELLGRSMGPLGRLRSRHGVVFVTGNHEYYFGGAEWVEYLRAQGLTVLHNQRISVGDSGNGGASFDLAGVPDLHGGRFLDGHEPDLDSALRDRDEERELVLLAHQPRQIDSTRGRRVGLQLSGHTHGGQVWPFGALVSLSQPFIAGLHREIDGTQIYVSRGTGFWGPAMRVWAPAEIASVVLTA